MIGTLNLKIVTLGFELRTPLVAEEPLYQLSYSVSVNVMSMYRVYKSMCIHICITNNYGGTSGVGGGRIIQC